MRDRTSWRNSTLIGFGVVAVVVLSLLIAWYGLDPKIGKRTQSVRSLEELGRFWYVQNFSLLERNGTIVNLSKLQGKIWVADFIYTKCQDTCPLQSAKMALLQEEFVGNNNFRLVSITVDPDRDNPQTLSRYADRFQAHPERWLFLTGNKNEIYHLAQEGFRLNAVPTLATEDNHDRTVIHSSKFVLVDSSAQIRGFYDSHDEEALRRLKRAIRSLIQKSS